MHVHSRANYSLYKAINNFYTTIEYIQYLNKQTKQNPRLPHFVVKLLFLGNGFI